MGRKSGSYEEHQFYCLNCGKKGIPIQRRVGHQHGAGHRKTLYCINCQLEVNHIECRNSFEVQEFKENFLKGAYKDEAENSISYVRMSRLGKEPLG